MDSKDLSKCKGVQFSLFPVCTKSIKVMTLVPTVKGKFQRSQRCRRRRIILRWLSSIQRSSNAHIWKREAAGWEKQQRKKITACSQVAKENQYSHEADTLLGRVWKYIKIWKKEKTEKQKNRKIENRKTKPAITSSISVHYHPLPTAAICAATWQTSPRNCLK